MTSLPLFIRLLQYVLVPAVALPLSGPVATPGASVLPLPVFNTAPAPVGTDASDASEGQAAAAVNPFPQVIQLTSGAP